VTIESGADVARRRYTAGTVIRVGLVYVDVRVKPPRGGTYVERYRVRNGVREGGGRAELIRGDTDNPAARDQARRRTQHIDTLYREWSRRRTDVETLRQLRDALSEYLDEALVP
jgi:hypothetical protein